MQEKLENSICRICFDKNHHHFSRLSGTHFLHQNCQSVAWRLLRSPDCPTVAVLAVSFRFLCFFFVWGRLAYDAFGSRQTWYDVYVQCIQNNSLYLRPVNRDLANVQDCFLMPVGSRKLAHNLNFKAITGTAERVRTWRTCPLYRGVARGGAGGPEPPLPGIRQIS